MKRFYSPTLTTCFKSGLVLALFSAVPTLVFHYFGSILPTGIAAIIVAASLVNNSLAQAGFHAVLIRLSTYTTLVETVIILLAILISFIIFVIASNMLVFLENGFDAARIIAATSLISLLPFTAFILSMGFKK